MRGCSQYRNNAEIASVGPCQVISHNLSFVCKVASIVSAIDIIRNQ